MYNKDGILCTSTAQDCASKFYWLQETLSNGTEIWLQVEQSEVESIEFRVNDRSTCLAIRYIEATKLYRIAEVNCYDMGTVTYVACQYKCSSLAGFHLE